MKQKSIIIIIDPIDRVISQYKYDDYEYLLNMVEHYKVITMKTGEIFLFFKINENEYKHVDYLKEHTLVPISFLSNFKNCGYTK